MKGKSQNVSHDESQPGMNEGHPRINESWPGKVGGLSNKDNRPQWRP
jgi:hypothetical protein